MIRIAVRQGQADSVTSRPTVVAALIAATIGAFWIAAWAVGAVPRWDAARMITVKTNMAVGQFLAGIALLLLARRGGRQWTRWTGMALGAVVLLIGALTLCEHIFRVNVGIDQLLFDEPRGAAATAAPNRMGIPGSVSLLLLGLGLIALGTGRRAVPQYLGLATCVVNLMPAVGFIYGIHEFYSNTHLSSIAWPTVVALISLGLGMTAARRDAGPLELLLRDDPGGMLLRRMMPLVILIPLTLGFLRILGQEKGIYDTATGTGLLVVSMILVFSGMLWISAIGLSRLSSIERQVQESLRENEQRLRATFDNAALGIVEVDAAGRFLAVNSRICDILGYTREEMLTKDIHEITYPADRDRSDRINTEVAEGRSDMIDYEKRYLRSDGHPLWVHVTVSAIRDGSGHFMRAIGTVEDISETKAAQEELQRNQMVLTQAGRMASLGAWYIQYSNYDDLDANPLHWSDEVFRIFGYEPGAVEVTNKLFFDHVHPDDRQKVRDAVGLAFEKRNQYSVEHRILRTDGVERVVLENAEVSFDRLGRPLRLVGAVQDITDRKRAEDALSKSEERYRELFLSMQEAFFLAQVITEEHGTPVDWVYLTVNEECSRYMQMPQDRLTGHRYSEAVANPDPAWISMLGDVALGGDPVRREVYAPTHRRWLMVNAYSPNRGEAAVTFFDITERRHAEEALRRAEARWSTAIESFAEGAIIATEDEQVIYWNPAARDLHGFSTPEEGIEPLEETPKTFDLLTPDGSHLLTLDEWPMKRIKRGENVRDLELRLRRPDQGWEKIVSYSGSMVDTPDGERLIFLSVHDLTEQRKAEEDLRASEERFRSVAENMFEGLMFFDAEGKVVYQNLASLRIHGFQTDDAGQLSQADLSVMWQGWDETGRHLPLDEWPLSRVSRGENVRDQVLHARREDTGHEFWASYNGSPIYDAQGRLLLSFITIHEITDRVRAEQDLAERERRLRAIFESDMIGMIFWTMGGQITAANDRFLQMMGYTREDLLTGAINWAAMTPPEYQTVDERAVSELKTTGIDTPYEKEYIRKDGSRIPIIIGASMLDEARYEGVAFVLDISVRKQAEEALRESEEKFRAVFEQAAVGMGRVSFQDGTWIDVNDAFCRMLGYTAEEFRGTPWWKITHPDDVELDMTPFKQLAAGQITGYSVEKRFIRKDGQHVWTRLTLSLVRNSDGQPDYEVAIVEDVTGQKHFEAELSQLNAQLEQRVAERTKELEDTNKELEAFSYSVSHDLRAPLRAIDGFSNTLLKRYRDSIDAQGQDYLDRVRAAAQRMAQLIDDILGLSRAGRAEIHRQQVDVSAMASGVLTELSESQPDRDVAVSVEAGLSAEADNHLLRIVFDNLLSNAWKFTSKTDNARIEVGSTTKDGETVFFVRDNGAGFNQERADKLFAPFQRLHTESEFAGTGIGLALVQRIIRRHGGRIWAEGETGKGAAFYFTLGDVA